MKRRPRMVHVTTTDISLALLLGPQLAAFRDATPFSAVTAGILGLTPLMFLVMHAPTLESAHRLFEHLVQ